MKQYRVGQILFLIADASKVVPIQVVEEVIRTTLEGKEKTYMIKFPDKKGTTVDIKKIKGTLFNSSEEVKKYMFNNAKNAIDQMIVMAEEMSINIFNNHPNDILPHSKTQEIISLDENDNINYENLDNKEELEIVQPNDEDGIITVDLGNGKFGKINVDNLNNAGAPQ